MTAWHQRPLEERALLNPSFCSVMLWHAASGYTSGDTRPLPVELAFLILPIVLHRDTRESLPNAVSTSLAVWLSNNPLKRAHIATRATTLVRFTKEALIFGGQHDLLVFEGNALRANDDRKKAVVASLRDTSNEVRACARRAEFTGRWFAKAGSSGTVMALVGVKP